MFSTNFSVSWANHNLPAFLMDQTQILECEMTERIIPSINTLTHLSKCTLSLPPENIRKCFSGGTERVHWDYQWRLKRGSPEYVIETISHHGTTSISRVSWVSSPTASTLPWSLQSLTRQNVSFHLPATPSKEDGRNWLPLMFLPSGPLKFGDQFRDFYIYINEEWFLRSQDI